MATETLQPDGSVFALTNLTGAAIDVDEGVDSPDGVWLTLSDDGSDSIVRASFPTPTSDPNTGSGLQKFRCYVRIGTEAGGNTPTIDIAVRETSGGSDLAVQTGISVTSYTGQVVEFTWDASVLGAVDGSAVELYAIGQRSGGSPGSRRCIEFDAIEWVVDYPSGGTNYDETGLTVAVTSTVAGTDAVLLVESGTVSAVSTVLGTDIHMMVEASAVAIVATVIGSDGLKFVETGGTVAASSSVTGTDTATFTDSGTVAVASSVTGSDIGIFVEALTVAVVATVTGSDVALFTDSGTVPIVASVTGTDAASLIETGGTIAATSTVTGSDALTATDSGIVEIVATVTGTDTHNSGVTNYDETGLTIPIIVTVTGTDVATFVEAFTVGIVATVTGTDTIYGISMWRPDPVIFTAAKVVSVGAPVAHTRLGPTS